MKELILNIDTTGTIQSLHNDFLADFEGDRHIERASEVEYDNSIKAWTVAILIGEFKGCYLPKTFNRRDEAISAEIDFFNKQMFN